MTHNASSVQNTAIQSPTLASTTHSRSCIASHHHGDGRFLRHHRQHCFPGWPHQHGLSRWRRTANCFWSSALVVEWREVGLSTPSQQVDSGKLISVMRFWIGTGRVGLAAGVGADFPDSCRKWLAAVGVDTTGLVPWSSPTLRTWQHSEPLDGSVLENLEGEISRETAADQSWEMLLPDLNLLPPLYQKAKTYHAGVHPSGLDVAFVRSLRNTGAQVVSVEVYMPAEHAIPHSELRALVSSGHIFSPNEREAASLVGAGTPLELIGRLSNLGAEIVVLRRGPLGSIVHRSDTKETWEVPAFHMAFHEEDNKQQLHCDSDMNSMHVKAIVDPTGCGNTFCGGFLAGWYRTRDLLTAALWGSVSASFMVEYEGTPPPLVSEWRAAAQLRLNVLQPHAKNIIFAASATSQHYGLHC